MTDSQRRPGQQARRAKKTKNTEDGGTARRGKKTDVQKVLGKGREKIEMRRQLNGHQNPSDDGWRSVAVKARPGNCMQLQNDDWAASR